MSDRLTQFRNYMAKLEGKTTVTVDRSVIEDALVVLFTAEQNGENGCIVCDQGWEPAKDLPVKHTEHCGLVRVRDALKKAIGA